MSRLSNLISTLKELRISNPANEGDRCIIMGRMVKRGLMPLLDMQKLTMKNYRRDIQDKVKKGTNKETLENELKENKELNILITETLKMDIGIFYEIIRQETL